MPHKKWCELLSTIEAKDNRKRAEDQIKNIAASKAHPPNYDSNSSLRVPLNNKDRTGSLSARKHHGKNTPKNIGSHR